MSLLEDLKLIKVTKSVIHKTVYKQVYVDMETNFGDRSYWASEPCGTELVGYELTVKVFQISEETFRELVKEVHDNIYGAQALWHRIAVSQPELLGHLLANLNLSYDDADYFKKKLAEKVADKEFDWKTYKHPRTTPFSFEREISFEQKAVKEYRIVDATDDLSWVDEGMFLTAKYRGNFSVQVGRYEPEYEASCHTQKVTLYFNEKHGINHHQVLSAFNHTYDKKRNVKVLKQAFEGAETLDLAEVEALPQTAVEEQIIETEEVIFHKGTENPFEGLSGLMKF